MSPVHPTLGGRGPDPEDLIPRPPQHEADVTRVLRWDDGARDEEQWEMTGPSTAREAYESRLRRLKDQGRKVQADSDGLTLTWTEHRDGYEATYTIRYYALREE